MVALLHRAVTWPFGRVTDDCIVATWKRMKLRAVMVIAALAVVAVQYQLEPQGPHVVMIEPAPFHNQVMAGFDAGTSTTLQHVFQASPADSPGGATYTFMRRVADRS
jgi:hypothetical protein